MGYIGDYIGDILGVIKVDTRCLDYSSRRLYMSHGLDLGWGGPIGEYIGFWWGPTKGCDPKP